jgi:hypothetical protein
VTPVPALVGEARLGQLIFNDGNLSEPRGTACVACHQANQGFAGNNGSRIGVAQGSRPGTLGLRNAMANSYAGFVPALSFETVDGVTEALGGHFWDGRADTLLVSAEVLLELGDVDGAEAWIKEAATLTENTGNAYDITHAAVVGSALARYRRDAPMAIHNALSARRSAEHQALVAPHAPTGVQRGSG